MGQLLVEGGEPERNIERAEKLIKEASEKMCNLIVLPETVDFAWTHPSCIKEAEPIPGKHSDVFCRLAKEYKIYICVGLTEKKKNGKIFNTAILISKKGKIILKYHKINLLEVEQPFYEVGDKIKVIDTEFGKIGVNICADNYKDSIHIAKTLGAMGAQIILSPSSWTVDYGITEKDDPYKEKWIKPLGYIAKMYDLIFVSVTSVGYIVGGPYEGKKKVGCSLAVNKNGIIKKGQVNEFAGEAVCFDAEILQNKEKGVCLTEKIKEKGFKSEIDIWEN